MQSETGTVRYGETAIHYDVQPAERRTLAIDVYPDQHVVVRPPLAMPRDQVTAVVRKRVRWIVRQQRHFAAYPSDTRARAYVSGESYRYLGRQYRLKVTHGDQTGVKLQRGVLQVTVPPESGPERVERALDAWYRAHAQLVFRERLDACIARMGMLETPSPPLEIRRMKTRWGSCSRSGVIRLNLRLIQASRDCIDYVITHELCHLTEHNHSKRYYTLLDRALPEWRAVRHKLNTYEFQ